MILVQAEELVPSGESTGHEICWQYGLSLNDENC